MQLEDMRRHADQYKEQVEKANSRVKALKRQLDETGKELWREKSQKRKAQRELEDMLDMLETQETTNRELATLRNKLRWAGQGSGGR